MSGLLAGCEALQGRRIQFACDRQSIGALEGFYSPAGARTCHNVDPQGTLAEASQSLLGCQSDKLL